MPTEVKGFGTMFCGHAAAVQWRKPGLLSELGDHDVVLCVTAFYLPLIPLKAFHTFRWSGEFCQTVEISRSRRLLVRALVRPYLLALLGLSGFAVACAALGVGLFFFLGSAASGKPAEEGAWLWFTVPIATFLFSLGLWLWMDAADQRDRDIRLVLGPHRFGSSDPALWSPETRAALKPSESLFGTGDEVAAAVTALQAGRYAEAMLAARLATVSRPREGELLTDRILKDVRVRERLPELRRKPWRRSELFAGDDAPGLDPGIAAKGENPLCYRCGREIDDGSGLTFYDGRTYGVGCLDGAGGDGFAGLVRNEPVLVRRAPSPWLVKIVVIALLAVFTWGGITVFQDPGQTRKTEMLLGQAVLLGLFGYFLVGSFLRKVTLGGGELRIGMPGRGIPIDGIVEVYHRRSLFIPIVAVKIAGRELSWPEGPKALNDIERALNAAATLRRRPEPAS